MTTQMRRKPTKRFYMILIAFAVIIALIVGAIALAGSAKKNKEAEKPVESDAGLVSASPSAAPEPTPVPTPSNQQVITIAVAGDVMVHENQLNAAKQEDGSYSFDEVFTDVAPILSRADLTMVNYETVSMGAPYTTYPKFNTPECLMGTLKDSGVDVLTFANNHICDQGKDGLVGTLRNIAATGLRYTGSFVSEQDANYPVVIDVDGIKIGIVAYTSMFNGLEDCIDSETRKWMLNYGDDWGKIQRNIQALRDNGADIVVACVHWGEEYTREPNDQQKEWADEYIKLGADVVFGSHPHMLQQMEWKTVTDDEGKERKAFVAYSLGNFVSDQREQYKDTGMILELQVVKDLTSGEISLGEASYTPTYVARMDKGSEEYTYRIVPCGFYKDKDYVKNTLDEGNAKRLQETWQEATELLGSDAAAPLEK